MNTMNNITDTEALRAARMIKKFCDGKRCLDNCIFFNAHDDECYIIGDPDCWEIPNLKDSGYGTALQDSGTRRQFETGAVRDVQQGKGRMDLLPWAAIIRLAKHFEAGATKYGERNWEKGIPIHCFVDSAFRHMAKYTEGETDEDHLIAAAWNLLCAAWTEEKLPEMQDMPARMDKQKKDVVSWW